MNVICVHCEKTRDANDCWCCIDRGTKYYECKNNLECDTLKTERIVQKQNKEKKKEKEEQETEIREVEVTTISLQTMKVEEWSQKRKSEGFFSSLLSFFSTSSYTKIKNE